MGKFGIGTHATTIAPSCPNELGDGLIDVTYHSTKVVRYSDRSIFLNSGGHTTTTTKRRMNEVSKTFDLGYTVVQRDYSWFVVWQDKIYTFHDGMRFDRQSGIVYDPYDFPMIDVTEQMRASIAI